MSMTARATFALLLAVIGCKPSRPRAEHHELVDAAAPLHSRTAVFLAILDDHRQHNDRYRAWQRIMDESVANQLITPLGPRYPNRISGLDTRDHVHFWAEQLLAIGGDTAQAAAVAHLGRIGNSAAVDALAAYVQEPGSRFALWQAARALGQLGCGRELAEALAAYQHPNIAPTAIPGSIATIKSGLDLLPAQRRPYVENELLTALEKEPLSSDQRAGFLAALSVFGSDAAAGRLTHLRDTDWGKRMTTEIDAAIAAILALPPVL